MLISVELKALKGKAYESERETAADYMMAHWGTGLSELKEYATQRLGGQLSLHWVLAYPEIFNKGGFDAFIGNPPFVGGRRIRRTYGLDYLFWLTDVLIPGSSGNADLCSFFLRRTQMLLNKRGYVGLITTNTISEGDTRVVGLDGIYAAGCQVFRSVSSMKWPGAAVLEVAHIWYSNDKWEGQFILDGLMVCSIDSSLKVPGGVIGRPFPLAENVSKSFQGSIVLGQGFVLTPEHARRLIEIDPKYRKVLFPYLRGEDFTSSPTQEPSTWVINFFDWPLRREDAPPGYEGPVAHDFPDCIEIIKKLVLPERTRKDENGEYVLRKPLPQKWWIYADKRPALYKTINNLERVLFHSFTGKYVAFDFVSNGQVYAGPHNVFALDGDEYFAVLQSSFHISWTLEYCSRMKTDVRYANGDVFETFPFPRQLPGLQSIGLKYQSYRQVIMSAHSVGLTGIYNKFHDPSENGADTNEFRHLHSVMDQAVAAAYGWQDVGLGHGFHETKQGIRYTISEAARREILDRLLALNHQRHAEEEAEKAAMPVSASAKRGRKPKDTGGQITMDL